MKYKKAQISKTLMWIVATIIIIIILAVSIIITATFGRRIGKRTYEDVEFIREADLFATKSLTSYLLTEDDSGKNIFEEIKEQEDLNDFNGNLAKKIYNDPGVWLGVSSGGLEEGKFVFWKNEFFGKRPIFGKMKVEGAAYRIEILVSETIHLSDDKDLELIFYRKKE